MSRTRTKTIIKSIQRFILTVLILFGTISVKAAPLNIVVSIAPLQALAEGILGDKGKVTGIVPANMSPHSYTLKPADLRAMSNANAIIWIGPQLEFFLFKSIENLKSSHSVMTVIDLPGLQLFKTRTGEAWGGDHQASGNIQDFKSESLLPSQQYSLDPHLWLDPNNAKIILTQMTDLVAKHDPANQAYYRRNLEKRLAELNTLDAELKLKLSAISHKPYLVFHDGYQYFEKHYQLNDQGMVLINSEIPLSGKQLQEIHEKIKQLKIICVFKEPYTNEKQANRVVHGTQAKLGQLDPLDSGPITGWQSYPELLKKDAAAVAECLR